MEHTCPTCEREFKGISDYPLVYIAKLERVDLRAGAVFEDYIPARKDVTNIILQQLSSYFDTLEGLVGKEVPTKQALPAFDKIRYGQYRIPSTSYDLALHGLDDEWGSQMLTQEGLYVPSLETSHPSRKLAFVIAQSGVGSMSQVHF